LVGLECGAEPIDVDATVTASEEIDTQDIPYANFIFNFNQDVSVDSIHVDLPDTTLLAPYDVPDIADDYAEETDYDFRIYWLDGEENVVLKGTYTLHFWGNRASDGEAFELSKDASIN